MAKKKVHLPHRLQMRVDDKFLLSIDLWIAKQPEPMTRSQAIRALLDHALTGPTGLTRRQLENLNAGDMKAVDDA